MKRPTVRAAALQAVWRPLNERLRAELETACLPLRLADTFTPQSLAAFVEPPCAVGQRVAA